MRRTAIWLSLALSGLAAPAALAAPSAPAPAPRAPYPIVQVGPKLMAIDPATVPQACGTLVRAARSPSAPAALAARVSLASCMAERAVAPLELCDCGQSVVDIDQAVAPAIAVLDDAIAVGDPALQAIAQHAKGELYAGFAMRLIATLPAQSPSATPEALSLYDARKQALEAQLAPWRDTARAAFTQVVELARLHPEIARNPTAATAIRDSQQRVAADVAMR